MHQYNCNQSNPLDTTQASRAQALAIAINSNTPATETLKEELDKAYAEIVSLRMTNTSLQGEV